MGGKIQASTLKIIAHLVENQAAKVDLLGRVIRLCEQARVGLYRRMSNLIQQTNQLCPQFGKKRLELRDG